MSDVLEISALPTIFTLNDHPLRDSLHREMHGRKLPPIAGPTRLMQVILAVDEEDVPKERAILREFFSAPMNELAEDTRYWRGEKSDVRCIWERHTEFSSYMFVRSGISEKLFDSSDFNIIPAGWFGHLPGRVVRATQLAVVPAEVPDLVAESFDSEDLVHCELMDGLAALWSDFRLKEDGFGWLLIVDRGMTPSESALCVQRVQELGNYRNLALLGLPVAQRGGPRLSELEQGLTVTTQTIGDRTALDGDLLSSLSDLSAEVARIMADTHYRMSASRAYAEMVEDRLRALRVVRVPGHPTLGDFTERRLLPAVRTCMSFSSRLEVLSQRVAWTNGLLRTRVDTELSRQNRDLLRSMDRRTALQFRLQQTVEKLSVVAISYYAIGLLDHMFRGIKFSFGFNREDIMTMLAILLPVTVWVGLKRVHYKLARDFPEPTEQNIKLNRNPKA